MGGGGGRGVARGSIVGVINYGFILHCLVIPPLGITSCMFTVAIELTAELNVAQNSSLQDLTCTILYCLFCSISDTVDELKKSSRHGKYLENISYSQVSLSRFIHNNEKNTELKVFLICQNWPARLVGSI